MRTIFPASFPPRNTRKAHGDNDECDCDDCALAGLAAFHLCGEGQRQDTGDGRKDCAGRSGNECEEQSDGVDDGDPSLVQILECGENGDSGVAGDRRPADEADDGQCQHNGVHNEADNGTDGDVLLLPILRNRGHVDEAEDLEAGILESAPDNIPNARGAGSLEFRGVDGIVCHTGLENDKVNDCKADEQDCGHVSGSLSVNLAAEDGDENEGAAGQQNADEIRHAVALKQGRTSRNCAGGCKNVQAPDLKFEEYCAEYLYGLVCFLCPFTVAVGTVELRAEQYLAACDTDENHGENADDDTEGTELAEEVPRLITGRKTAADMGAEPYSADAVCQSQICFLLINEKHQPFCISEAFLPPQFSTNLTFKQICFNFCPALFLEPKKAFLGIHFSTNSDFCT